MVSYVGGAGPGRPGKRHPMKSQWQRLQKRRSWQKSIRPEDCVQDLLPGFAGIEVSLFDYPLQKAYFFNSQK